MGNYLVDSRRAGVKLAPMAKDPASRLAMEIRNRQLSIIEYAEELLNGEPLPGRIAEAFLETPRHEFAPRFADGSPGLWSEVDDSILYQNLYVIYADTPYCLFRDESGETTSTISQPSLVLYMLYLLDLQPGHRVFELGGGSGWNAALMGRLVGENGHVASYEIEPALVENARKALRNSGIGNVSLILGDGSSEMPGERTFDRGVFTASSWDLPAFLFDCIRENGLLLFVLNLEPSSDVLLALRKTGTFFTSELQFPCRFVSLAGARSTPLAGSRSTESRFKAWLRESGGDLSVLKLSARLATERFQAGPKEFLLHRGDADFVWSRGD